MKTNETVVICSYCDKPIMPEDGMVCVQMYKTECFCDEQCCKNFEAEAIDAHL
jgi:ribosomal protein L24E